MVLVIILFSCLIHRYKFPWNNRLSLFLLDFITEPHRYLEIEVHVILRGKEDTMHGGKDADFLHLGVTKDLVGAILQPRMIDVGKDNPTYVMTQQTVIKIQFYTTNKP